MAEIYSNPMEQAVQYHNPFSRAKEALTKAKNNLLYGRPAVPSIEPNMPPTVQYALQYKEGKVGRPEVESLINNNFTDLSTYILLKGLNSEPEKQQAFLEEFVDLTCAEKPDKEKLKDLQRSTLQQGFNSETQVKGAKIAQITRQGVNLWEQKFREIADELKTETIDAVPVYMAYAGTLGLRQGIETFKNTDRKVMIMIPDWIKEESMDKSGYEIDLRAEKGNRVKFVGKDFTRPEKFVFIDDTRRNGVHTQMMWDFWTNNSGIPPTDDHVRVVDFAPKAQLV